MIDAFEKKTGKENAFAALSQQILFRVFLTFVVLSCQSKIRHFSLEILMPREYANALNAEFHY